jgi:small subunit ribosomal protein S7
VETVDEEPRTPATPAPEPAPSPAPEPVAAPAPEAPASVAPAPEATAALQAPAPAPPAPATPAPPAPAAPAPPAQPRKGAVLLFGKYDFEGIAVKDPGLIRYINVKPIAVPHTSGRHANKSFAKQRLNIVERLINGMMRSEHSTGEKAHAYNTVREAFRIIHERTKLNPIQVYVDALQNVSPREEITRLRFGGISVPKAVDVSSSRRLDVALRNMCRGVIESSHKNKKRLAQCLADEIINASQGKVESAAMAKREEVERVAASAR